MVLRLARNGSFLALAVLLASAVLPLPAVGADNNWPQWRGPLGTGAAPDADPPTRWSETENVKWKVKLPGGGRSSPIVWDKYVFVQTAIPTGKKPEAAAAPGDADIGAEVQLVQQERRGPGGPGGRGERGRGPGGPGGRGGFGRGG